MEQIEFYQKKYEQQLRHNEDYCKSINGIIAKLKDIAPGIDNEDITTFLAAPESLVSKLENQAWEEYKSYLTTIPPSVANSLRFSFDAGDKIRQLHKTLPTSRSVLFTDNVARIEDGLCVVDTEELKQRCTIYGKEAVAKVWQDCKVLVETLNRLESEIQDLSHKDMHVLEQPMSLNLGLVMNVNGSYSLDLDRLESLVASANKE